MGERELIEIFSKALKVDKSKININTTADEIEEWDSLGHLAILSAIDEATSGEASKIENLGAQQSLKGLLDLLNKNNL